MRDAKREFSKGHFLCEVCFDAMTDTMLTADASPTGEDMAICAACQRVPFPIRWVCAGTFDEMEGWARSLYMADLLGMLRLEVIMSATSLTGVQAPWVYLVGTYAQRDDWPSIAAALQACQADCHEVILD